MSLTSFLAEPDVRTKMREMFPSQRFVLEQKEAVEPLTKQYSLVGTAFDYLLRWVLQHDHGHAKDKPWVAELVVVYLYNDVVMMYDEQVAKLMVQYVKNAKHSHDQYLRDGVLTDELIRSAILLAQIDPFFRAGQLYQPFGEVDAGDMQDLRQLAGRVPFSQFASSKLCLLNPTFGSSALVGGADADIVLDHMLIDIKTVKALQIKRDYLDQLLGYYTLYRLGGIEGAPKDHQITHVGIYFSRFGTLVIFPIAQFIEEKTYAPFLAWFQDRAQQRTHREGRNDLPK